LHGGRPASRTRARPGARALSSSDRLQRETAQGNFRARRGVVSHVGHRSRHAGGAARPLPHPPPPPPTIFRRLPWLGGRRAAGGGGARAGGGGPTRGRARSPPPEGKGTPFGGGCCAGGATPLVCS